MTGADTNRGGVVCLVGAGPGDPGLITDRGLALLRRADVVVFDALVNPVLLDQAPPGAERIGVGKRAGAHGLSQEQINRLLVDKARPGRLVVRLKGGDPYLFGRGAEEMAYVADRGLSCEVVPGVTAGIAVPAAAGIPVTHRRLASTVTFVTGHEDPAKGHPSIDYTSLAGLVAAGGTVCFYMGVARLPELAGQLRRCGVADQTPVAVIEWGTLPRQRSVCTSLVDAPTAAAGLGAPAIIVVGAVAGLHTPGLDAFTRRPLFGQRIVITRAHHQAPRLRNMLDELGAQTIEAPTIELVPPDDWSGVDEAVRDLSRYDWLVLTSANGVEALAQRLDVLGLDARWIGNTRVAAIGDATAATLHGRLGIRADLVPRPLRGRVAGRIADRRPRCEGQAVLAPAGRYRPPRTAAAACWGRRTCNRADSLPHTPTRQPARAGDRGVAGRRGGLGRVQQLIDRSSHGRPAWR